MKSGDTLTINVTQEDIDHGEPCQTTWCPLARAICRALGYPDPEVTPSGIEVWASTIHQTLTSPIVDEITPHSHLLAHLPQTAVHWRNRFDLWGDGYPIDHLAPFTFQITLLVDPL
jgi:hypothetical protein